ncbi:peptide ABC transporter substrate-binding protein [Tissierella carlieri]|uniref:Peptide ABC transporter substrate-binding protein n=1 Tax=Tissierella carlieri TaxID=689904 RepID=A0ABT1SB80_9FIRM|nr:peptide ABC transporter substrate-binding protein [Tissierella carlieri]MBU5310772.1 peptide ABC transporter substrate-binding protein [Tissierella carlieri]MCQ4923237.1 peptide ABC transporter substrate-binding protein [Tissierella carlieri]MDU5079746.1 peptide ABC transporter substrate-binding protein [Bacillota bacterium]
MRNKKFLALSMAILLILLAVAGCGKKDDAVVDKPTDTAGGENDEVAAIDSEQYLNLILSAEPSTLDASKGSDSYSNGILNNVLEPLTRLEEDENQANFLAPAGAENWEHNEDGTVWTFKIRDSVWSDGVKVRAQDYEYGIKRSVAKETAAPYAYLLTPIKNAEKVNSGELSVEELGVKSLDDNTLEITLESPTPYFLSLTYQRVMLPQREDIVEQYGDKYGSELDTLVYNGPFTLTSWVHNSELILTKNENYWGKDEVKLQNINLKIIQDENAVYNSLSNGSVDLATANKPEWKEKFMKDENLTHLEVVNPNTFFMFFNTQDKVFKNANIRKAFSAAINREELANVIFHGVHAPAYGWVPPNINIGDDEYRTVAESPVKKLADENPDPKALLIKGLEELGMDPDPSKLTVKISLGATDQWFRTFGEYLQQMYIKNLGVNFEVEQMEWPVFNSNVEEGDFQIGYMAWGAEFNDPIAMLSLLKSDSAAIGTGWVNPRYDELIELSAKEMDPVKRLEYFKEAEKILLYDEAALAPVVYQRLNVFQYKYVNNLGVTPFGTQGYKYGFTQGR